MVSRGFFCCHVILFEHQNHTAFQQVIRASVITTLGKIGPAAREAVPALKEALADGAARWRVEKALTRITGN